ncbi:MAG TPA: AMP-binding protein [Thermoleophilaceae bacterium]
MDDWLTLRARTHADHPAVVAEGRTVTYAELDSALEPVDGPVLEPARGTHRFVVRLWSAWRAGVPFVPLDPRLAEPPGVPSVAGNVRTVVFTSGTSGCPKPVALTAANHEASAIASAWNLGVAPDDRWLCCLPLHHVGGLAILHRCAIYGTTAVLHDGFDARAVAAALESGEATLVSLVATMLRRLRDGGLGETPGLRAALIGGGPVPRDLLEWAAARGLPALQTYGMTETASQVATLPASDAIAHHGSAGRPLPGVELCIGDGGEILVRGPMVATGALAADGWLHTGDRGHLDEDGFLHVEGRIDDVVVTGGENVAATEVEDALLSHPAVADAAVAGRPSAEWGEAVTAWVVLATAVADHELAAHCRGRLAPFKVPKAFVRVDELPRNAAGKLVRSRLT